MVKYLLEENKKSVLLANEAIARGAIEAGLGFSSCYPGTPSSEIPIALAEMSKEVGFHFEWSVNEKVAFESCAAAAMCGVRSLNAVKHFGLNVALDSVLPIAYFGTKGGFVIVVADDPHGWSSAQSEQDSRHCGVMAKIPMIEPSDPQEAKDFTIKAFELSEKYEIPVILHTTTKVNHTIGTVQLGQLPKQIKTKGEFEHDRERYNNITPGLQKLHTKILEKLNVIEKEYDSFNKIVGKKNSKIGIITSGVCYQFLMEMGVEKHAQIAKLNIIYPFPKKFVSKFIKKLKTVIVVEQLDPFLERFVKEVALETNPKLKIYGKNILPQVDELESDLIYSKIAPILGLKVPNWSKEDKIYSKFNIPTRMPVMCPGCPHRSSFYAVRKVVPEDTPMPGDVGCYILGILPPMFTQEFCISMGASAGIAHGFCKVGTKRPLIFMGDSTFFHSGMPPLVNLRFNETAPIVVILDNSWTAMTGQQPNPGSGRNQYGDITEKVSIEEIVKAMGIKNIEVVNTWSQKDLQEKLKKLWSSPELGVLISRGECRLMMRRRLWSQGRDFTKFQIDMKKCTACGECIDKFACPAIQRSEDGKKYWIEPALCWGCSICSQLCPPKAISAQMPAKETKEVPK